jgi:hypothetical protein
MALYLASMLVSGALSLLAVRSLRKKRVAEGVRIPPIILPASAFLTHQQSTMLWIFVLFFSLVIYALISVIEASAVIDYRVEITSGGYVALYWISEFFHALALITVMVIARDTVWRSDVFATTGAPVEQQYHAYSYQQDPIYNGMGQRA